MGFQRMTSWIKVIAVCSVAMTYFNGMTSAIADVFSDYEQSYQAFYQWTSDHHEPPRFNDREGAVFIRRVTDQKEILGSINFNDSDTAMHALESICHHAARLPIAYITQGIDTSEQTAKSQLFNKNVNTYQNEITAAVSFSAKCASQSYLMYPPFFHKTPINKLTSNQRQGFALSRLGGINVMMGTLIDAKDPILTKENRATLLQVLVDITPNIITILTMQQREQWKEFVNNSRHSLPKDQQSYIDKINNAIDSTSCDEICQFKTS